MIKQCEICGKEIDLTEYQRPNRVKYCSKSCNQKQYSRTHRKQKARNSLNYYYRKIRPKRFDKDFFCEYCNGEFIPHRHTQRFCSRKCGQIYYYKIRNRKMYKKYKLENCIPDKFSDDHLNKIRGKKHYLWKEKVSKKCLNCDNEFEVLKKGWNFSRKFCSLECYHEYSIEERHWHWHENRDDIIRREGKEFTFKQKREIREKNKMICQLCGIKTEMDGNKSDCSIHIDHILPIQFGGTNDISNGRVLCKKCNTVTAKIFANKRYGSEVG